MHIKVFPAGVLGPVLRQARATGPGARPARADRAEHRTACGRCGGPDLRLASTGGARGALVSAGEAGDGPHRRGPPEAFPDRGHLTG